MLPLHISLLDIIVHAYYTNSYSHSLSVATFTTYMYIFPSFTGQDDTVRVIWSYSKSDPTSETDLHYHEARGTKSLYLKAPQFKLPPTSPNVKTLDLLARNVSDSFHCTRRGACGLLLLRS